MTKEYTKEYIEGEIEQRIGAMIKKEQVDFSSELRVIADEVFAEELEEKILKLAADIIENSDGEKKIIRVDDI